MRASWPWRGLLTRRGGATASPGGGPAAALTLVAVAISVFWLSSLYGFLAPFYYGHYGYHGGSYATWARGTLRYHTLLPVNMPGFSGPLPGSYYIHHPIFTHQLVTATFALFGEHEWTVRLAALVPSFASLLLVAAILWRNVNPLAGAVGALVFAIVPVNVWYAVNIDQGFPSIACLLASFWFYLRWLKRGHGRHAALFLAFEALAGGFEWSPYFAFPVVFSHVAYTAWRRRGRYLALGALHPLVVLLPLGVHAVAVRRSGMLSDLLVAYHNRAAEMSYADFLATMRAYGATLFGRALLGAMFLWLGLALLDVVRGRGRAVQLVGATFAVALLLYVHVFKVAVATHAYRQLYGNVWAAWAVADLSQRVRRFIEGRRHAAGWRARPLLRGGLAWVVPVAVLGSTAPLAWHGLLESRAHGGIPGWTTFNPDLRQTVFAKLVERQTTPLDTIYFHYGFPPSPPARMDWAFYYDRDQVRGVALSSVELLPADVREHAVVALSVTNLSLPEQQLYRGLSERHPVVRVADLALVDLRRAGRSKQFFALDLTPRPGMTWWARWLAGPYPWPRLAADGTAAADELRWLSTLPPNPAGLPRVVPTLSPKFRPREVASPRAALGAERPQRPFPGARSGATPRPPPGAVSRPPAGDRAPSGRAY